MRAQWRERGNNTRGRWNNNRNQNNRGGFRNWNNNNGGNQGQNQFQSRRGGFRGRGNNNRGNGNNRGPPAPPPDGWPESKFPKGACFECGSMDHMKFDCQKFKIGRAHV